jgi:hypothetical protein
MKSYTWGLGIKDLKDFSSTEDLRLANINNVIEVKNIKPNMSRACLPSGNMCVRNEIRCIYLLDRKVKHFCGLSYNTDDNTMTEIVDYIKICATVEKYNGFEE